MINASISGNAINLAGVDPDRLTGLPVPLEISFAIADGWLYAAMSPQGLLAAIEQGGGARPGLMENANFREAIVGDSIDGAFQVTFFDSPPVAGTMYISLANEPSTRA